jgi:Transglycosylase-like domain
MWRHLTAPAAILLLSILLPCSTPAEALQESPSGGLVASGYVEGRDSSAPSRTGERPEFVGDGLDPLESALRWQARKPPTPEPVSTGLDWPALRECEAGHLGYRANTGNGYYGAYQFDLTTWQGVGGTGYPHLASPAEQDMRAQILYDDRGASPWPNCGALL